MQVVTNILLTLTLVVIIAFFVVLIVMTIVKGIAKSKKLVEVALKQVLLKKCNKQPNKTMVFTNKDGSIITVKYLPKQGH